MSNALDQMSCIKHRDTARYITYYEDYQEMSEKNPDKIAAFLRILEVKTNKRLIAFETLLEDAVLNGKELPELNLWIEVSYNDFIYWSLNTMGRSSFQIADKEAESMMLVKNRVLKRSLRPNDPDSPKVQYKEYLLVIENIQAKIDGRELPITGQAFEEYGTVPPVFKNIPLLKKTWDMLQKTREDMFLKTAPPVEKNISPVEKNRLINKDINNTKSNHSKENQEEGKRENAPTRPRKKASVVKEVQEESFDLSFLSENDRSIYDSLTKTHKVWYLKFNGNGRHNYATWLQKLKKPTYIALGEKTVETLNACPMLSLDELVELEKFAYKIDGEYLRKHGGFQIHHVLIFLPKWQADRERQRASKPTSVPTGQSSQQTPPDDEQRLVAWTRTGKYEGDPEKNWQQFELMTIGEALKYGWHKGIFPGVTHSKIMIQLRKQQAAQAAQGKQQVSA